MDSRTLAGIAGALVAVCPMVAGAQAPASGPQIAHYTGDVPHFGFLAGPSKSDVAYSNSGDELLQRFQIEDPAVQISAGVAGEIAKRKGGSLVVGGKADFTVKVETIRWSAGYSVPSRPTYSVEYAAHLTITDGAGAVVKTADCQVNPDDNNSAGSNDEFIAHKGRTLKTMLAKAGADCQRTLISKTKGV